MQTGKPQVQQETGSAMFDGLLSLVVLPATAQRLVFACCRRGDGHLSHTYLNQLTEVQRRAERLRWSHCSALFSHSARLLIPVSLRLEAHGLFWASSLTDLAAERWWLGLCCGAWALGPGPWAWSQRERAAVLAYWTHPRQGVGVGAVIVSAGVNSGM